MSERTGPARPTESTRWVRERGGARIGAWHRPSVWPAAPDALVATMCGREVVIDCSASVGSGGVPHPACSECAP